MIICTAFSINEKARIPEYIENGYEVYLDGTQVDADAIDVSQYNATVDKEKECIF